MAQAMAAMNLADSQDASWFPDTGASAHMTASTGKLQNFHKYHGHDKILVGHTHWYYLNQEWNS